MTLRKQLTNLAEAWSVTIIAASAAHVDLDFAREAHTQNHTAETTQCDGCDAVNAALRRFDTLNTSAYHTQDALKGLLRAIPADELPNSGERTHTSLPVWAREYIETLRA